jgi:hypothetical protein
MSNSHKHNLSTPLTRYIEAHPYLSWADIEEVDEDDLMKFGFKEALHRAYARSERLASSGASNTMPRKTRKEHYRRKAQLEERKEAARRAQWRAEFPDAPESAWTRREERRQRRKADERHTRRIRKQIASASGRRSSSGSRKRQ